MLITEGEGNMAEELLPFVRSATEQGVGSIITSHYAGANIRGTTYIAGVKATEAGAGHSGKLNYVGVWVLMAWLIAWHPESKREDLQELFAKYAKIL